MHFLFLLLLLECAKGSITLSPSDLSSIVFLQCTPGFRGHKYHVSGGKNGKVEPKELLDENTTNGFVCSKSANNRIKMWNSGYFRDYLLAVRSPSDFITYVDDFIKRMNESASRVDFDHTTLLLLLKDGVMFALAAINKEGEDSSTELLDEMVNKVLDLVDCVIKYSTFANTYVPSFSSPKVLPSLPFSQPHCAKQLSLVNAIRMVRLSENSHLRAQYDTTEIVHYIVRNYGALNPPWMIKKREASIEESERWLEPYLANLIYVTDRKEYLTRLFFTMGITMLHRDKTIQGSSYLNGLMYIDQITFQMEYACSMEHTKESIILEYLSKVTKDKETYNYIERYMGLWKELVTSDFASILYYQVDFLKTVFRKINIARIYLILRHPSDFHRLTLLDKVERFFK